MARRKAHCQLPLSDNWTFFASFHGWGTMSGYWSKSLCSKGGGSLWAQISGRMGRRPSTTVGVRKLVSWLSRGVVCVLRDPMFSRFDTIQYLRVTDRHTDIRRLPIPALASVARVKDTCTINSSVKSSQWIERWIFPPKRGITLTSHDPISFSCVRVFQLAKYKTDKNTSFRRLTARIQIETMCWRLFTRHVLLMLLYWHDIARSILQHRHRSLNKRRCARIVFDNNKPQWRSVRLLVQWLLARPRKFWWYPYRRYNMLKLVSFWPERCLVFEKWCCSCRFCVQHAKLTHCLPKNAKNGHFHFFSYSLTYATQIPAKVPNTDFCHVRDLQAYISRHLKYFWTL